MRGNIEIGDDAAEIEKRWKQREERIYISNPVWLICCDLEYGDVLIRLSRVITAFLCLKAKEVRTGGQE